MFFFNYFATVCSGAAPTKTGLQWQQPFLELVLACMNAQTTTHEELLGPLKTQLSTFLSAFEKVSSRISPYIHNNMIMVGFLCVQG